MQSRDLLTLTVLAAAALLPHRFCTAGGAVAAVDGTDAHGVTLSSAAIGALTPVRVLGTAVIEAGAAITANAVISCDSVGRAVAHAGGARRLGRALQAAGAAGDRIECLLFQV
jgi:hypothetical protein